MEFFHCFYFSYFPFSNSSRTRRADDTKTVLFHSRKKKYSPPSNRHNEQ